MDPLPRPLPQDMNRVYTPRKELPPSLSFGSSSSPVLESPPTVEKELRFMHWSPPHEQNGKGRAPQLLPSHFPPTQFNTLPSSPPEPRSRRDSPEDGSPRPRRRVVRQNGRDTYPPNLKRKADLELVGRPSKLGTRSAGFPLLSSKAFARACTASHNKLSASRQVGVQNHAAIEPQLEPELELIQEQYPSRGLGLSFIIDLNGKANVNPLVLTPPTPQREIKTPPSTDTTNNILMTPHTRQTVNAILEEESDLESDGEFEENTDRLTSTPEMVTRTPPRFASLGNSDAASAFARTLARSREVGKGSMFLFQTAAASPRKQGEFTASYAPFTPYTPYIPESPRRTAGSDSSGLFEFGLQTPPNPGYGFDTSGGYYATGMTPYLSAVRSQEVVNI